MTSNAIVYFSSRACKLNLHQKCHGKWYGFNFEVFCHCSCHKNRKIALDVAPNSATNAAETLEPSKERAPK